METPSSTSSSEPRAGGWRPPWAFLLAIGLVLAFEVGLRAALPVEEFPTRSNLRESAGLQHVMDHYGAAEIGFVGASVTRRAIHVPLVRETCEAELGRDVTVANYGHVGLKARLGEDVVRVVLRQEPPPRLLLYGVTPHQIRIRSTGEKKTSWVWSLEDWFAEWDEEGTAVLSELPQVVRNEARRYSRTFQVRYARDEVYDRIVHGAPFLPSSMMGELHHHGAAANVNILRRPPAWTGPDMIRLRGKIRACTQDDRFVFSEERIAALRRVQLACGERGVRLVFFEIPLPLLHTQLFPPGTLEDFRAHMDRLAAEVGLTFIPFPDLGIQVTERHFADQSHLNLPGATLFTRALLEKTILSEMRRLEQD